MPFIHCQKLTWPLRTTPISVVYHWVRAVSVKPWVAQESKPGNGLEHWIIWEPNQQGCELWRHNPNIEAWPLGILGNLRSGLLDSISLNTVYYYNCTPISFSGFQFFYAFHSKSHSDTLQNSDNFPSVLGILFTRLSRPLCPKAGPTYLFYGHSTPYWTTIFRK